MSEKKKKIHYIDNVKFSDECEKYVDLYNYNKVNNLPKPQINRYLGECIILLATKVASMPAFNCYTYKDEMISDAIEISVRYFHKYNKNAVSKRTGKSTAGAHAYFTQIMWRRMLKRRADEKLVMFTREKYIAQSDDVFAEILAGEEGEHIDSLKQILGEMSGDGWIEFDQKLAAKKKLIEDEKLMKYLEEDITDEDELEEDLDVVNLPLDEFLEDED